MKPFSAIYYIKENKPRVIALIILIATISICYLGGLYISSPVSQMIESINDNKDFVLVYQTSDKISKDDFQSIINTAKGFDSVSKIININNNMGVWLNTVIGDGFYDFNITRFHSTDDLKTYNDLVSTIPLNCPLPKDGEMVMSDTFAKNLGIKLGDIITSKDERFYNVDSDYIVTGIYKSNQYNILAVNENIGANTYLALRKNVSQEKIKSAQINLENDFENLEKNNVGIRSYTYNYALSRRLDGIGMFYSIFYAIVALISLVLVITINAIFAGAYEKRQYEFSVYKAIGFSKKEITKKIVNEVMLINAVGIGIAVILISLTVFLLNLFVLIPSGENLSYFEWIGLLPTIICDLLVVLSVILKQTRKIKKYDITQY